MDIANTLRAARLTAGRTQTELAAEANTSQATISAYESGAKQPSIETLGRLLAPLGYRLTAQPGAAGVRQPSAAELEAAARTLGDVIGLAEALPARHEPTLRFPRLPSPPVS